MIDIAALFVANLFSQFYRSFLAVLAPALRADLGIGPAALSDAAGAWFLAFALAQIPVGIALDRYGPRRVAGWLVILGGGGGGLWFSAAGSAAELTAAMAVIGIGCAPVLMAGMVLFANRYSPARFATLAGAMIGFGSLGNVLGAAPLARAAEIFGWRDVMTALALGAALVGALLLIVVRDPPRRPVAGDGPLRGLLEVLKIPELRLLAPLALCNYAVAAGIRGSWAGPYLADVHGMDAVAIGDAVLWMALAMVAGNFLCGPLAARLGSVKWTVAPLNLAGAALALTLALSSPGPGLAAALLAALGFCGATYALLTSHARSFLPLHLTGRGVTLVNFFGIGGVGLGQLVTGRIHSFATANESGMNFAYAAVFGYYGTALALALCVYAFSAEAGARRR